MIIGLYHQKQNGEQQNEARLGDRVAVAVAAVAGADAARRYCGAQFRAIAVNQVLIDLAIWFFLVNRLWTLNNQTGQVRIIWKGPQEIFVALCWAKLLNLYYVL